MVLNYIKNNINILRLFKNKQKGCEILIQISFMTSMPGIYVLSETQGFQILQK